MGEEKSAYVSQGKFKYASLRNTYNILSSSGNFPKYNYMFHIFTVKVVLLIQHMQENIQFKAGCLHNITIDGHKFKNIPVYECGGKCIQFLFK